MLSQFVVSSVKIAHVFDCLLMNVSNDYDAIKKAKHDILDSQYLAQQLSALESTREWQRIVGGFYDGASNKEETSK